jgi:hypothetical protein
MIPADCVPTNPNETVMEILEGPNRHGKYMFFLYWIGQGHHHGTRRQVFLADPAKYKHDRVVDRRGQNQRENDTER